MTSTLRFLFVLHNHQPIGNFEAVFEQAYRDSYLPFLDIFEEFSDLKLALHTSGCLMEWLDARHPEYVDRLAKLAGSGKIEIVGGAFHEPILTMIPSRDRVGQIRSYTDWLSNRLKVSIQGMWLPERVWEQSLTSDLATAGIRYTILDDFHFRCTGLTKDELHRFYVTEDNGHLLAVFPGSESLRYSIPFAPPQQSISYLGEMAEKHPGAVVVFADDGEKFGTWPDTKKHVYEDGWLRHFFELLEANQSWITTATPNEVLQEVPPLGKVYLAESSYREMNEWALPAERLVEWEQVRHELEDDPRWPRVAPAVRGGFWRNFKRKYPESDEMYSRMHMVSSRLQQAGEAGISEKVLDRVRHELYRGQCNCSYWHGAFGGIYLPHLRGAIYQHLIAADNLLEKATSPAGEWVRARADDFNFDTRQEIELANDQLVAFLAPARGGQLYELDVRSIRHNLLATMTRRPEAYHAKVLSGSSPGSGEVASIHERVVFKQKGLDGLVQYDSHPRKSLLDHFYDPSTTLDAVAGGVAAERGSFLAASFTTRLRRDSDRVQVLLNHTGHVEDHPITITKGISLQAASSSLMITYLLERLPVEQPLHFGVEFNFSGLPADMSDRYFRSSARDSLGHLGTQLDLTETNAIGLVDEWLGIDVALSMDRPSDIWTFPVKTVSQSEGGFELVHQSVVVQPHWIVQGDSEGRWKVTMTLALDTSQAFQRQEERDPVLSS